jgi:replicative DNA helicase
MNDIITGIPTGFEKLDYMTSGLQRGDLIVVAAKSGLGKTSFCLKIAINAAINYQLPVGIFTLETTKEQLMLRMFSIKTLIPPSLLRTGLIKDEDLPIIYKTKEDLGHAKIYINDSYQLNISQLCTEAIRQKVEKGLEIILVDYLQLISSGVGHAIRDFEIEAIYRSLKVLAEELNIPVIVASQLNRDSEEGKYKQSQVAHNSNISCMQKYADIILIINEEEIDTMCSDGIAQLTVSKQNKGTIGKINLASLSDIRGVPTFIDLAEDFEEEFV